jgi:Ser/Thr protein kinase RdoA (MazF antagonist)
VTVALEAWPDFADEPVRPLPGGLINRTFVVGDPARAVLQRQHPMFPPRVNHDIHAVTAHVAASGMTTPTLIRTTRGDLCHVDPDGDAWRMLTFVPGSTIDAVDTLDCAAEAGALVARWHLATADLDHEFRFVRSGAHDTELHMTALQTAVDAFPQHRLYDDVAPLADNILRAWDRWDGELDRPVRLTHGDLKISNLRFDDHGRGVCILDFDTLGRLSIDVELGDAARSWCNPAGEDVEHAVFDAERFGAAFGAYLRVHPLPVEDRQALVFTTERICFELAARFAADALREDYFGWKPEAHPARGEHNLLRARGQASLGNSVRAQRCPLEALLSDRLR